MKILSAFFILVTCILVIVVTAVTFANAAKEQQVSSVKPAWTTRNTASSSGTGLSVGPPLAVGTFSAGSGYTPTLIGSTFDPMSATTTWCVMDPTKSGTCIPSKIKYQQSAQQFNKIVVADFLGQSFLISFAQEDTWFNQGAATAVRWNPDFGAEWSVNQGYLPSFATSILVDRDNNRQHVVVAAATSANWSDVVTGQFVDHKYVQESVARIIIDNSAFERPNEAWAHDLTWIDETHFAALSLGGVYVIDSTNGKIVKSVPSPCFITQYGGPTMYADRIAGQLFVAGSSALDGSFTLCALSLDVNLNQLWSSTINDPVTFLSDEGVQSLTSFRSAFFNKTTGKTQAEDIVTVVGAYGNTNIQSSQVYAWSITNQQYLWQIVRSPNELSNYPVLVGGSHDSNILLSINGVLTGLNPVTQATSWTCTDPSNPKAMEQGFLGCLNTPVLYNDNNNAKIRAVCLSQVGGSNNATTMVAFDIDTVSPGSCTLKWVNQLPVTLDTFAQPIPASSFYKNTTGNSRYEPFVSVLGSDGSIWTMPFRANNEQ